MSTGTKNGRDRYRFDEDDSELDAVLREEAAETKTAQECAEAAAERLDDDPGRLRVRVYQLGLYEPDWPSHVTREQVEMVAAQVDTVREAADELRLSRTRTKRALRWAGVADEVERVTMLSVLNKVRDGDLDAQVNGGED